MIAYVYDPRVQKHTMDGHAEHAGRLAAIMARLTGAGLLDRMHPLPVRPATDAEMRRVHTEDHLAAVADLSAAGGGMLDPDTYCCPDSWEVARLLCGALVDLCGAVQSGTAAGGLALLRPPAHHATESDPMGFCLVNQVAVAVAALRAANPGLRVAVVDFDVHHGNGTADIFCMEPAVLYVSSHQYPHFPGTGSINDRGVGPGKGATVNIPLPAGTGDFGLLRAYEDIVMPILDRFGPDFILVSAGFDAHRDDPLAGLKASTTGYTWLSGLLLDAARRLCGGRIVFNLEGGYDLDALADCVEGTVRVLLDGPPDQRPDTDPAGEPDLSGLFTDIRVAHGLD